jgi:mono/diheme cytochrome c family protein
MGDLTRMIISSRIFAAAWILMLVGSPFAAAGEPTPEQRGRKAIEENAYNPIIWSARAYDRVWTLWQLGTNAKPEAYSKAFEEHYGLSLPPFQNGDLPMGLRRVKSIFGAGITTDCLLCHGGSIAGQSYVGLGNASLEMQGLYEDMAVADGRSRHTPFTFTNVRGTVEAGAMAVFLLSWRDADLNLHGPHLDLGLRDDLCEDVPAWWLLKKKKTMYYTGSASARSVRSLLQFMLSPLNGPADIKKAEADFADIQAYLVSLAPPKYPFAIDPDLAAKGEMLFKDNCARCHGTYGPNWTYPNRIVPIDQIGTDRTRFDGLSKKAGDHYNRSWFAREKAGWLTDDYRAVATGGYQAPPLDGIWATAPYFHNGSVPTVYHVLNSHARPGIFTRSYRTDTAAYDAKRLGWKYQEIGTLDRSQLTPREQRGIYDTTQPGRGNGGHTFGDGLTEEERSAVIEYLKTL